MQSEGWSWTSLTLPHWLCIYLFIFFFKDSTQKSYSLGAFPRQEVLFSSFLLLLLNASCYKCSFPLVTSLNWASQVVLVVKNLPANAGDSKRQEFDPWIRKIPWNRKWQPIPIFLPGKFHAQRSLAGYSPWGRKESDTTEWLHFHFILDFKSEKLND